VSPAWSAEWLLALRRRRLLALNAGIPLLLVAPIALAGAPAAHAAAAYSALFVLFGVFGSAIPLVRDGASGLLTRWHLAGMPPRELLASRIAAQTALDVLEALPATAFIFVASGGAEGGASAAGALLLALPFTLLVANALGAWAAALARSLAEGALFASVLSLLLLHAAGTFRTPATGSLGAAVERFSPFRTLHEAFLGAAGGGVVDGSTWTPALLGGAALLLATAVTGPFLVGRLSRSQD
jgi:hypothetical protein